MDRMNGGHSDLDKGLEALSRLQVSPLTLVLSGRLRSSND